MGGAAAVKEKARAALDARRLPLGRDAARPPRLRRPERRRGARAAGARLRPARLPGRERRVARRLSDAARTSCATACPKQRARRRASRGDILARIPLDLFFTAMATRLDGPKAARARADDAQLRLHRRRRDARAERSRTACCTTGSATPTRTPPSTVKLTRALFLKLGDGSGRAQGPDLLGRARRGRQPHRAALVLRRARPGGPELRDRDALSVPPLSCAVSSRIVPSHDTRALARSRLASTTNT